MKILIIISIVFLHLNLQAKNLTVKSMLKDLQNQYDLVVKEHSDAESFLRSGLISLVDFKEVQLKLEKSDYCKKSANLLKFIIDEKEKEFNEGLISESDVENSERRLIKIWADCSARYPF